MFIYLKIFSAITYLYIYKNYKIIFGIIIAFILSYILLIDSSQTYSNIEYNNNSITRVINKTYKETENGNFFIDSSTSTKKMLQLYVQEDINEEFMFKHLKKYNLFYIENSENKIFEIEFHHKKINILIQNIYNSYINNEVNSKHLPQDNTYISYFKNNNEDNIHFSEFFYRVLTIMTNQDEHEELSEVLENINIEYDCSTYELLFNVNKLNGRISVLCK